MLNPEIIKSLQNILQSFLQFKFFVFVPADFKIIIFVTLIIIIII